LLLARGLIRAVNRERSAYLVELELVGLGVGLEDVKVSASYVLELEFVGLGIVLEDIYTARLWGGVADALDPLRTG
jgi:hypothetical protein